MTSIRTTVILEVGNGEMFQHSGLIKQEPRRNIVVNELQIVNVPRNDIPIASLTPYQCTWEKILVNRSVRCVRQKEE